MNRLKTLSKFKIKVGEPNFLIGTAGNGISTALQTEIFGSNMPNIHYLNFINFAVPTENKILIDISNAILTSVGIKKIEITPDFFKDQFDIFKRVVDDIQTHEFKKEIKIALIFDEFNQLKEYSNAFFFTLDKILSIGNLFDKLEITSVLISDEYINPKKVNPSEGMGKMFYHYFNFFIIPAPSCEEFRNNPIKQLQSDLSEPAKRRLYELSMGNPALFVSILDTEFEKINPEELLKDYEVEWKVTELWDSIGEENRDILKAISLHGNYKLDNNLQKEFLEKSKLVDLNEEKILPVLLNHHVNKLSKIDEQYSNSKNILIISKHQVYLQEFSPQLSDTLKLLHDRENEVVSRDEIAETLWGQNYLDKYSDYAIDKLVSKLRKQLTKMGLPKNTIRTKKGVGYYLSD